MGMFVVGEALDPGGIQGVFQFGTVLCATEDRGDYLFIQNPYKCFLWNILHVLPDQKFEVFLIAHTLIDLITGIPGIQVVFGKFGLSGYRTG